MKKITLICTVEPQKNWCYQTWFVTLATNHVLTEPRFIQYHFPKMWFNPNHGLYFEVSFHSNEPRFGLTSVHTIPTCQTVVHFCGSPQTNHGF